MNFLIDNWYVIIGLAAILAAAIFGVINFALEPSSVQIAKVKEWLKYAVTIAEHELGSGTGQLKLRYVYDLFLSKFGWIAKFISFSDFSMWVDEALLWLENQLESNKAIKELVNEGK